MDPKFQLGNQSNPMGPRFEITFTDQNLVSGNGNQIYSAQEHSTGGELLPPSQPFSNGNVPDSLADINDDDEDDCDFSNEVLKYIDQMLMEVDMEDKTHMLQESLDLHAKEKSFCELRGKKYPPSTQPKSCCISQCIESRDDNRSSSNGSCYLIDISDPSGMCSHTSLVQSHSTYNVANSYVNLYSESQSVWNFNKGVEEASKIPPSGSKLAVNVDINGLPAEGQSLGDTFELEKKDDEDRSPRDKKKCHFLETDLEEERSSKLPSIISDSNVHIKEVDALLLHSVGEGKEKFAAFRADLQSTATTHVQQNGQRKVFSVGKGHGKKPEKKKEVIDLRTLLITCAQAVATDDRRSASELLKQIRQHSSPYGDETQRLAYYFADGLEARLAGNGSKLHKAIDSRKTTAADFLKAYYTYLASSPFRKISGFASNKTIIEKSREATRVHVIDFGIHYGFQWPSLIQRISFREGGPLRLHITGIDFPQPGLKPAKKIEDTGRRLARYAKTFNIPFEYNAIAQNWETINLEDLKIEEDEFVVVTCLYRTKNLLDQTVGAESSRTQVLNLIRRINPAIFIHGIVNGTYSAPYFLTRFKEVLFHFSALFDMLEHFSALFDMLENNIPREKPERLLIERDIFGREAFNVIACEGWERVEKPETFKQCQAWNLKAGFSQVPFDREVMSMSTEKVRSFYHKDFSIEENGKWILLGWKGRIIYAISCWKPV